MVTRNIGRTRPTIKLGGTSVKVIRRSLFHIAANIIGNFNWLWFR